MKAHNGKATGYDEIPIEVLRNDTCRDFLLIMFNICFNNGIVPEDWGKGIISPIPKPSTKDNRNPSEYRGLTLASAIYKLYCSVLNCRLDNWVEENGYLCDEQNGFRHGRSTEEHLLTLSNIIETRKARGLETYVSFVDFKKAYDSIIRALLWQKLRHMGICGRFFKSLQAIYLNTTNCVRINKGLHTEWFQVQNGLKQGCLLSPLLFNIYINDLAEDINSLGKGIVCGDRMVSLLMYADDLVLISDTTEGLQLMLDTLHSWCVKWQILVNCDKTQVVHFRQMRHEKTSHIFMCGELELSLVDRYNYLGLIFTEHLCYKTMVKNVAQSAQRALGLLIAKSKAHGGFSYSTYTKLYDSHTKLYDSLVWPVINYGAAIWGTKEYTNINSVHNRACRFFMGVGKFTPTAALQGDMGWTVPQVRQGTSVIRC
jgi:hypothetical protein